LVRLPERVVRLLKLVPLLWVGPVTFTGHVLQEIEEFAASSWSARFLRSIPSNSSMGIM
jgi:hypothetical protein